jgi:uncharacterized protein (TIGR00369 family)
MDTSARPMRDLVLCPTDVDGRARNPGLASLAPDTAFGHAFRMPDDDLIESLRHFSEGGFWDHVGITTASAKPGEATCRVILDDRHRNYNGVAHGGVTSALVDSAAGVAARTLRTADEISERPHATADLHVSYLAGANGNELIATARVVRRGRTATFIDVDVHDEHGRHVAKGSVTFIVGALRDP